MSGSEGSHGGEPSRKCQVPMRRRARHVGAGAPAGLRKVGSSGGSLEGGFMIGYLNDCTCPRTSSSPWVCPSVITGMCPVQWCWCNALLPLP